MSGFSPRVVGAASGAIQQLLQMYNAFMNMPDPDPTIRANLPKGVDPPPWGLRLGLPDLLDQALLTLKKEISYGQPQYEPADPLPLDLEAIAAQLQPLLNQGLSNAESSELLSATGIISESTYGIPRLSTILDSYLRSNRSDLQGSIPFRSSAESLYPSPGASVSADPTRTPIDANGREYGSVSVSQSTGFKPPISGNGVDPIWQQFY
jgi:hypothetical protein